MRHLHVGCYLRATSKTLPEWGFKQIEVTCDKQKRQDLTTLWNIEEHINEKIPIKPNVVMKSSFWHDFIQVNVGMYTTNNALTPDPDKEPDYLTSFPWQWPLMLRGLRIVGWGDSTLKFYLLGNPVVWWGGFASLVLLATLSTVYFLRSKRGCVDFTPGIFLFCNVFDF